MADRAGGEIIIDFGCVSVPVLDNLQSLLDVMADQVKLTWLQLLHKQQYCLHQMILSFHVVHAGCGAIFMGTSTACCCGLATALWSTHGRLRVVPLLLVLLAHDTLVVPGSARSADLDRAVLLILTLAAVRGSSTRLL